MSITQANALESLVLCLGDETGNYIEKNKFVALLEALEQQDRAEDLWGELLDFCHIKDPNSTTISKLSAGKMYESDEYNPEMASAALIAKLKSLFDAIDTSGDGEIELAEFVGGTWKESLLSEMKNSVRELGLDPKKMELDSVLDLDDEVLERVLGAVDLDGNKTLDFTDFCAAVLHIDPSSLSLVKPEVTESKESKTTKSSLRDKIYSGAKMNKVSLSSALNRILSDPTFGQGWLTELFEAYPEARALFGSSVNVASNPAMVMVLKIINPSDRFEDVLPQLQRQGVKQVLMGVKFEYYENLLHAIVDAFGEELAREDRQMWVDVFAHIYHIMNTANEMIEGDFENPMLDPTEATPVEFARYLRHLALSHRASHHDYLVRLSEGDFPDMNLALCQLFDQYALYGDNFVKYMKTLVDETSDPELKQLLLDDISSEEGALGDDDWIELESLGVDPSKVHGVPHRVLFRRMLDRIDDVCNPNKDLPVFWEKGPGYKFAAEVGQLVDQLDYPSRVAALGIGIECIVPTVYEYLISAIRSHTDLSPEDYVFLSLHVSVDANHGANMEDIVASEDRTAEVRSQMLLSLNAILDARVRLWDGLMLGLLDNHTDSGKSLDVSSRTMSNVQSAEEKKNEEADDAPTLSSSTKMANTPSQDPETLYDKTSKLWARSEPNCLSDFTARPFFFDLCRRYIADGTWIVDIGCGEGYCTRALRDLKPHGVIGVDLSGKMIGLAKQAEEKYGGKDIFYLQGDACETLSLIQGNFLNFGFAGEGEVHEAFGLITAVFLFNYMSIADMRVVGEQVLSLLKPGGRFIFTVPHPALRYWDREPVAPFYLHKEGSEGYFEDRDRRVAGVIHTKDGHELNIQSMHKTMSDYFHFLCELGFIIEDVHELGTDKEMVMKDPEFFKGVQDIPLHVAIKVIKPNATVENWLTEARGSGKEKSESEKVNDLAKAKDRALLKNGSAASTGSDILVPPKEVLWSCIDYGSRFVLNMPESVRQELVESAQICISKGIDHTNYTPGDVWPMMQVKRFGQKCANRLMRKHGNLIVKGLDIDSLAGTEEERECVAKLCYYILMSCTGNINVTRGRLFDVKDRGLDVTKDNVLFSASSQECGWHSDGSARDWFPDMVCLLCIRPAKLGGEFQIANACNAFHDLRNVLPPFLMYELVRPVVRDIIEKGASAGFGRDVVADDPASFWVSLSRQPQILRQRIRVNSYPIFERDELTRQNKFRYLDHWMYSGHQKAGLRVSPLLKIAVTEMDKALHRHCRFDRRLERGEIAMANNHLIAHRRNCFSDPSDDPDYRGRLLVRCWLKVD